MRKKIDRIILTDSGSKKRTGWTGLKRMEFWSNGVLLYKLALQYSIAPILQQKILLSCLKKENLILIGYK